MPFTEPFDADSGPGLQAHLNQDPRYLALRAQFQKTQAPLDWVNLTQYVNRVLDAGANNSRTGHVQVDGTGSVQMQNANNRWTSPATWGPVAVGGATLGLGLLGSGPSGATSAATTTTGATAPAATTTAGAAPGTTAAAATGATTAAKYGPFADGYGDATTDYDIPPGLDPNYTGDVGGYSPSGPYADQYAKPTTTPNVPGSLIKNGLATLPEHASPILKALAAVGGLLGGKYLGDQAAENAVPPQLTQLLDLAMQRANSQTPLFNATQKGFYDMLPTFAKQGGGK